VDKAIGSYPPVRVQGSGGMVVSQAGGVLLVADHGRCTILVATLAGAGPRALTAIRRSRAEVRERAWKLAQADAPDANGQVIVDMDGVLVLAHSEKQDATATWKRTFGHHPLVAFVDHGTAGSGEPVAGLLRPGNAGSNAAADHVATTKMALAQLPMKYRRGRQTLTPSASVNRNWAPGWGRSLRTISRIPVGQR